MRCSTYTSLLILIVIGYTECGDKPNDHLSNTEDTIENVSDDEFVNFLVSEATESSADDQKQDSIPQTSGEVGIEEETQEETKVYAELQPQKLYQEPIEQELQISPQPVEYHDDDLYVPHSITAQTQSYYVPPTVQPQQQLPTQEQQYFYEPEQPPQTYETPSMYPVQQYQSYQPQGPIPPPSMHPAQFYQPHVIHQPPPPMGPPLPYQQIPHQPPPQPQQPITQPAQYYVPPPIRPIQPYQPQQYAPPPIRPVQPYQPYQPYQPDQPYQPYQPEQQFGHYQPPPQQIPSQEPIPQQEPIPEYQPQQPIISQQPDDKITEEEDESDKSIEKPSKKPKKKGPKRIYKKCQNVNLIKRTDDGNLEVMTNTDYKSVYRDGSRERLRLYANLEQIYCDGEKAYQHENITPYPKSLIVSRRTMGFVTISDNVHILVRNLTGNWIKILRIVPDYVAFYGEDVNGKVFLLTDEQYYMDLNSSDTFKYTFISGIKCIRVEVEGLLVWEKTPEDKYPTSISIISKTHVLIYYRQHYCVYVKKDNGYKLTKINPRGRTDKS